jgi:hypothetical protein
MSQKFETTGGARVGWFNATWPLAKLSATPEALRVSVMGFGNYQFTPDSVTEITRYTSIPVLGWGIQIHHRVPQYPARILFWCLGNPENLLEGIRASGFIPQGPASETISHAKRGFPFRWVPFIAVIAAWNILLIADVLSKPPPTAPGPLSLLALALFFATAAAGLRFPAVQTFLLKPGRNIEEVRPLLRLLLLVSGVGFAGLSLMVVFSR